jgi:fused signal recognition particle receptor
MIKFLKRKKTEIDNSPVVSSGAEPEKKMGWFSRLKKGLTRTRHSLTDGIANLVLGKKVIDDALLDDLEMHLLAADVGVEVTQSIIEELTARVKRKQLDDPQVLLQTLQSLLQETIQAYAKPLTITSEQPYVILFVGVNGAGKTTTIGKLAKKLQAQGKSVMLAAGDTFRAAAIEQLQAWGERNQIPVVAQAQGSDSAAVIFDAIHSAKAKGVDVVIADTAGRLHTQEHLMRELAKIKRVMQKHDAQYPHEVMLVLDAGIGQNAIRQAEEFHQAVGVTGLALTKLDGTAKGGIVFAIAQKMQIPIRFIGVGESVDDLHEFDAEEFVNAMFTQQG